MEESRGKSHISQLETIKAIQSNLLQLRTRIQYLQKQETRTNNNFQKMLQSSKGIIRNKITESEIHKKNMKQVYQAQRERHQKIEGIRCERQANQLEIEKSRIQIKKERMNGSFYIRQISKKNHKIIEQNRREIINEKKRKNEWVKQSQQQSKIRIQQYHVQKQNELRRMKQLQKQKLDRRINRISQELANLIRVQEEQSQKISSNYQLIQKTKHILKSLHKMNSTQFIQSLKQSQIDLPDLDDLNLNNSKNRDLINDILLCVNSNMTPDSSSSKKYQWSKQNLSVTDYRDRDSKHKKQKNNFDWKQREIFKQGKKIQNFRFSMQQRPAYSKTKTQSTDVQKIYGSSFTDHNQSKKGGKFVYKYKYA